MNYNPMNYISIKPIPISLLFTSIWYYLQYFALNGESNWLTQEESTNQHKTQTLSVERYIWALSERKGGNKSSKQFWKAKKAYQGHKGGTCETLHSLKWQKGHPTISWNKDHMTTKSTKSSANEGKKSYEWRQKCSAWKTHKLDYNFMWFGFNK